MNHAKFDRKTYGLNPESDEYKELKSQLDKTQALIAKNSALKHKAVLRILEMIHPLKGLNRSKLQSMSIEQLLDLGKALKTISTLFPNPKGTERNNTDFDY